MLKHVDSVGYHDQNSLDNDDNFPNFLDDKAMPDDNETKDWKASFSKSLKAGIEAHSATIASLEQCFKGLKESTKRWGDLDPSLVAKSEAISKSMFGASSRMPYPNDLDTPSLEYSLALAGLSELSNDPSILELIAYNKLLGYPVWVTNAAIVSALSRFGIGAQEELIVKGGIL